MKGNITYNNVSHKTVTCPGSDSSVALPVRGWLGCSDTVHSFPASMLSKGQCYTRLCRGCLWNPIQCITLEWSIFSLTCHLYSFMSVHGILDRDMASIDLTVVTGQYKVAYSPALLSSSNAQQMDNKVVQDVVMSLSHYISTIYPL